MIREKSTQVVATLDSHRKYLHKQRNMMNEWKEALHLPNAVPGDAIGMPTDDGPVN